MNLVIYFILVCLLKTFSRNANAFNIKYDGESFRFAHLLSDLLDFHQQKINDNMFTDEDLKALAVLTEFVFKLKDNIHKRRMKERPVYWYSRQG